MGLFFKKSISLGKSLKLNLSKSGIGFSCGIKGFRISKNSKGTYLNAGRSGVYMRKKLDKKIKDDAIKEIDQEQKLKQTVYVYQTAEQEKFSNIFVLTGLCTIILFVGLILFNHPLRGFLILVVGLILVVVHAYKNPEQFKEFMEQGKQINQLKSQNFNVEIKNQAYNPNSDEAIKQRNENKYKEYKYSYETYNKRGLK